MFSGCDAFLKKGHNKSRHSLLIKISPQKYDKWRVTIVTGGKINGNLWHPHFKTAGLRVLQYLQRQILYFLSLKGI
jgi:hypothetical protein